MEHEERNYLYLVLLLVRVGNSTVRLYFKKQWDALGLFPVWTDCPQNGADLLTKYKPLSHEKDKVKSGDTSTWDLSLLVKVLLNSALPFVSDTNLIKALKCVRDMRNKICHASTPKVDAATFNKTWQDACDALTLLKATSDDFEQVKQDAGKPWENLKHLIQECANHDKEILNAVTNKLQEIFKRLETMEQAHLQGGNTNITINAKGNVQVVVGDNASWIRVLIPTQIIRVIFNYLTSLFMSAFTNVSQDASLPSTLTELDVKLASTNLKSSIMNGTEILRVGSPVFVKARTDDIFTNLVIQKHHPNLEGAGRMRQLDHCEMSSTAVDHIEEVFIGTERNPKLIQITGKPGIGKTFFCERIVRDWAKDQLFSSLDKSTVDGFQFAYLLKFRDLNLIENELNLCELLNLSSLLDEKSIVDDSLIKYFIENPDKLLIILDGYDEYKYGQNIADNYEKQYPNNPLERMPAQALLSKLINKRILNNSVIIVTSRPGEADKLEKSNFDEYVQIIGFSPQQVTEFVGKYFAANERMKTKVDEFVKTNVNISSFCHIPMMSFLMCGYLEWYLENSRHELPASTTDLFSKMITTFMKEPQKDPINTSGETASKSNAIKKALRNIQEFAAKLLENKKFVFEEKDMVDNLLPQEIKILKASGLLNCNGNVRKGPFEVQQVFEFIHLIVQEFLSAQCFVAINKIPKKQTSEMVFQFMSGLLARQQNDEMMTRIFETVKPNSALSQSKNEQHLFSLRCLCEYGDEKLADKLLSSNHHLYCCFNNALDLISFIQVTDIDCTAICWLLDSLSRQFDSNRRKMNLFLDRLSITRQNLIPSIIEPQRVKAFYISVSTLTVFGVQSLCDSVCRLSTVTVLTLCDCNLDDKCAVYIGGIITNTNITHLDLSGNNITDVGAVSLCSNVVRESCKVITLYLSHNKLITEKCRNFFGVYVQTLKPGVELDIFGASYIWEVPRLIFEFFGRYL